MGYRWLPLTTTAAGPLSASAVYTNDIATERQGTDGLTYTLSGTDKAGYFHVVPATGQILTLEKLDYEAKKEYKVTVKATDP